VARYIPASARDVQLALVAAFADHYFPPPAVKGLDLSDPWLRVQLGKRRDYVRLLATKWGIDPEEVERRLKGGQGPRAG
jgi:hypothetical protein